MTPIFLWVSVCRLAVCGVAYLLVIAVLNGFAVRDFYCPVRIANDFCYPAFF
jgi:hypothetical protein